MERCRYIALTDVNPSRLPWAERDDIQSLVRLLLYANEVDLEGIILCSSCFLKCGGGRGAEKIVQDMLDAYATAKPNLDRHAPGYPGADALRARVYGGIPAFGQAAGRGFAEDKYSNNPGVQCIIRAVDAPDPRPVWVGLWGGANTLAQAIWQVSRTRSDAALKHFLHKLRILSISDQDNSAAWIRQNWGDDLFYRVEPSEGTTKGTKDYCRAVWPGISGDHFQHGSEDGIHGGGFTGANKEVFREEWLDEHIRAVGPLGACYPKTVYMAEGDTPAFLGLLPNGLNKPEHPELGGWAGRYVQAIGPEQTLIWSGSADTVTGTDGKPHTGPQAGLWRWRTDFQNEFAARMQWTVQPEYARCVHPPIIRFQGETPDRCYPGRSVVLDASPSVNPDGGPLAFQWFWYTELCSKAALPTLTQTAPGCVTVTMQEEGRFHLVLAVRGEKAPCITRYARIELTFQKENRNLETVIIKTI
ncbi:nucleoside hydrolase-like domain-containing protein [Gemmiger sp.]